MQRIDHANARLVDIIRRNRAGQRIGIYPICSAHPSVINAGMQQALADSSLLLIESTSSQVNQLGGYTGQTPAQFAEFVRSAAQSAGLPTEKLILGGDHLGPYPWRNERSEAALRKACDLVRACVLAGYEKIHLDASMACADDASPALAEETIADRAALLCRSAEDAHRDLQAGPPPLYVIGTEVPIPGGETRGGAPPAVTTVDQLRRTLEVFRVAFERHQLEAAWERVIGIVVQPGVEFGENSIFAYHRQKAQTLASALPKDPCLVYEAHSTDYQTVEALTEMVEDHFAILKVGPALTFAYREAVFALSAIERESFGAQKGLQLSQVRESLDAAMLRNPVYWRPYYQGSDDELRQARAFSYSDRCRYYWTDPVVQEELRRLFHNLSERTLPLQIVSQCMPMEYAAIRVGNLPAEPKAMIRHRIGGVLRDYARVCGTLARRS